MFQGPDISLNTTFHLAPRPTRMLLQPLAVSRRLFAHLISKLWTFSLPIILVTRKKLSKMKLYLLTPRRKWSLILNWLRLTLSLQTMENKLTSWTLWPITTPRRLLILTNKKLSLLSTSCANSKRPTSTAQPKHRNMLRLFQKKWRLPPESRVASNHTLPISWFSTE